MKTVNEITFNDVPQALAHLIDKAEKIETLLTQPKPLKELDQWLDIAELCNYLPDRPVRQTVYQWVNKSMIPAHKRGKKLLFLKSEIDNWLQENYNINKIKS
jgi:excisionase family DNA binding protein